NRLVSARALIEMQLASAANSVEAIHRRLPKAGGKFSLRELVEAFESFYTSDRLVSCEDDSLVVVSGKYGERPQRRFEIALFRTFNLTTQVEVSLRYSLSLRYLFFATASDYCESQIDASRVFEAIRSANWYYFFETTMPEACSVRWRDESQMAEMFCDV